MRLGNKLMTITQEDFTISGKLNKKEKSELNKFNQTLAVQRESLMENPHFKEESFDLRHLFTKYLVEFPRIRTTDLMAIYKHQLSIFCRLIERREEFIKKLLSTDKLEMFIDSEKKFATRDREVIPSFLLDNTLVYRKETFTLLDEHNNKEEVEIFSLVEEGKLNKRLTINLIEFGLENEKFNLADSFVELINSFRDLTKQFEEEIEKFGIDKEIEIGSNFTDKEPLSGYLGSISTVDEFKTLVDLSNKKKLILMLKKEIDIILKVIFR